MAVNDVQTITSVHDKQWKRGERHCLASLLYRTDGKKTGKKREMNCEDIVII